MKLVLMPTNIGEARAFVERHHSHHHAPVSGLCAVGVGDGAERVCVAILGRPVSRMLQEQGCAEIVRVASAGAPHEDPTKRTTTPHAASMAIGAITRAALALGYRRVVSSTLLGEAGKSYRAAGWWPVAVGAGGEWGRESRPRENADQPGVKVRWEFGPDAKPRDPDVDRLVRESVGKIVIPERREGLPLFERAAEQQAREQDGA